MMRGKTDLHGIVEHVGFQEVESLAQSACSCSGDRPHEQEGSRKPVCVAPESDLQSCLSIPANIAEGPRKTSEKEFARFLGIAVCSSSELESHLIFARDAKIISENEFVSFVSETIEIRKMLYALIKRLSGP